MLPARGHPRVTLRLHAVGVGVGVGVGVAVAVQAGMQIRTRKRTRDRTCGRARVRGGHVRSRSGGCARQNLRMSNAYRHACARNTRTREKKAAAD